MANSKPTKTSFKPGNSANPTGRPPGTTPRGKFRKMVEADLPEIVQTLVNNAKAGDPQAIKIILDRVVPALKPTAPEISMRVTGTLQERGQAFINAMTAGRITPDQAAVAMNSLAAQAKLVESGDVIERLEQLEALVCGTAKKLTD